MYKCYVCGKIHEVDKYGIEPDVYEYRGVYSCAEHFDDMVEMRDFKRREIIKEEDSKTKFFKGLDFNPDTPILEKLIVKFSKDALKLLLKNLKD